MFIQTETTPNPDALKFFPGTRLVEAGSTRWTAQSTGLQEAPLARELLALDGVVDVRITRDYVTVRKSPDIDWPGLKVFTLCVIADFAEFGWPALTAPSHGTDGPATPYTSEAERQILEVIDLSVRPALARDGGDVRLHRYEAGTKTVWIELLGACGGCPSARITLKQGIERILGEQLAFVHHVEEVGGAGAGEPRRDFKAWADGEGRERPATVFAYQGSPVSAQSR